MKRYLLFVWDHYYPSGGMRDFIGDFDDSAVAIEAGHKATDGEWEKRFQVFDIVDNVQVMLHIAYNG